MHQPRAGRRPAELPLKLASTGALLASYGYDSDGMRQTATVGGTTTRFAADAVSNEIVALLDSAGAVVSSFVRDAAGALVAMVTSGAVYAYLTNAHGDVTALVDAAGAVVARWTYDAWGSPTEYDAAGNQVPVGTAGNPFLFAGYFFDAVTGLYYLRARYYDPGTGRFLSMDPEPGALTDRLSQNPYIYCQNDPVNHTDRTGRRIDAFGGTTRPTAKQQVAANKVANAAWKKRQAEARRAAAQRAEADRAARAGMDASRVAQGTATRVRNKLYESVRTGQIQWDMALNGSSRDEIRSTVRGIQTSAGYQQWERGKADEYAAYRQSVAARSREIASVRAYELQQEQIFWQAAQETARTLGMGVAIVGLATLVAGVALVTAPAWLAPVGFGLGVAGVLLAGTGVWTALGRRNSKDPTYSEKAFTSDVAWNAVGVVLGSAGVKLGRLSTARWVAGPAASTDELAAVSKSLKVMNATGFSVPRLTYPVYRTLESMDEEPDYGE